MRVHFIEIEARTPQGAPEYVRFTSVDDRRACHFLGQTWMPAVGQLPTLAYDFFGGDFAGRIETPTGTFTAALSGMPDLSSTRFAGAPVRIWQSELGDNLLGNRALRFAGLASTEPSIDRGIVSFSIRPDDAWLDKPLLTTFAGTGGIEGPDEMEGTVKPLVLGACRFVPGTLIDAVDLVYCVSGYGAISGVTAVYDRAVSLGASGGDYADLAALLAADISPGSWATCYALGLVRLGAPADGLLSFHVSGDSAGAGGFVRKPGAMIGRIAELAGGTVDASHLAKLDAARPWNLTLVVLAQTTAREVIQQLADSVCAVAGVSLLGDLFVVPLGITAPIITFDSEGRSLPMVEDVAMQPTSEPYWRLATNAEITWSVHAQSDIGTLFNLRGKWNAARTYRLDDFVELEDGSGWVYISPTAQAGIEPGTDDTVWRIVRDPMAGMDGTDGIDGQDGKLVEFVFQRATSRPATPTGNGIPTGWADDPPDGTDPLWVSEGKQELDGTLIGVWSLPVRFDGPPGEDGEPGISPLSASALPAAVTVACTSNGTPKAGIPGFTVKCYQADADVTVAALGTPTVTNLTGVTHTGGGVFTVSGMTADTGSVSIPFSYGGAETVLQVPYTKSKDGAAFVRGSAGIVTPSGTTYEEVARVTLQMGPNGALNADCNGSFVKTGGGSLSMDGYFEVSMDGGSSWTTLPGTFTADTAAGVEDTGAYDGNAGDDGADLGLTSSRSVPVRLMMRRTGGATVFAFNGTMQVQWAGSA